jgi:molybdopterin converting factor small subunit
LIGVQLLPWLPALVGQDEHRRYRLEADSQPGDTVLTVLLRLGERDPPLLEQLWDAERHELKMVIEVAVNGAVLGIHHHLDSPLQPGDEILLVPQYQGG